MGAKAAACSLMQAHILLQSASQSAVFSKLAVYLNHQTLLRVSYGRYCNRCGENEDRPSASQADLVTS